LPLRILLDCSSGFIAALTVSPIMYTVDRSVSESASGKTTLLLCVKNCLGDIFLRPKTFIRDKKWQFVVFVYGITYMSANTIFSVC